MITAGQLRAARALLDIDQRQLADLAGLSVPTIQRMEASESVVRGNVDSLMKLVAALEKSGIELIGEGTASQGGGRGVRLKAPAVDNDRAERPDRPASFGEGPVTDAHRSRVDIDGLPHCPFSRGGRPRAYATCGSGYLWWQPHRLPHRIVGLCDSTRGTFAG